MEERGHSNVNFVTITLLKENKGRHITAFHQWNEIYKYYTPSDVAYFDCLFFIFLNSLFTMISFKRN